MRFANDVPEHFPTGDVGGAIVAFLRRADGWIGSDVLHIVDASRGSHGDRQFVRTLRAGDALYFRAEYIGGSDVGWCIDLPARVVLRPHLAEFYRVDPCGDAHLVGAFNEPLSGSCQWSGRDDGGVEVRCQQPDRSATFRWDSERFRLIPDAPTMPVVDPDGPLCRHSYD
ncbi:MAG: hypothetical protein R3A52_25750 [Polyangiales bacterium]